jgi:outer membrane lipoprotein carrier protein
MSLVPLLVLLLAAGANAPAGAAGDDAIARHLVERLEQVNARAPGLVARFVQSYRSGLLGRAVVEKGRVSVKRPGRMRWEYESPERKLFISDGKTFYFYVPEDHQVIIQEQDDERSLAARLLGGEGGLLEEFTATLDEPDEEGVLRVRLVPRRADADLARAFVDVEPSGRLRSVLVEDVQGGRTSFRFEDLREKAGLPDALFRFEIPSGVEVIHG